MNGTVQPGSAHSALSPTSRSGPAHRSLLAQSTETRDPPPPFTDVALSADSGQPVARWWTRSGWGGRLSHSESMGGGSENRGSLALLVDGKAVGGEVVDDDGLDQWLPE
jgi:hypothetical protein